MLNGFYWRIGDYAAGFKVLPPDSDDYQAIVKRVCAEHHLHTVARDEFALLNRGADGEPIVLSTLSITREAAHAFWQELCSIGALDFSTIVYLTRRLLRQYPSLAYALACRFKSILVKRC